MNVTLVHKPKPDYVEEQKPQILIVDDEEFNRRLLNRIVGQYADVIEAPDGYAAIQLIEEHHFDLVLLDIMMPVMHGFEVLEHIRQQASSNELPVILVSALDKTDDIVTGLQAGANDYIPKPIDVSLVEARVMTQLKLKAVYDLQKMANDRLREADSLKTRLLSIASHDLKSPLSNIGLAETLLREMVDTSDPTVVQILDTVKTTVDNMHDLIVEFLDMAEIQSGMSEADIEPVNIEVVIKDVINAHQLHSQEKGSVIIADCDAVMVMADVSRLPQVFNNLVSNALKYSPPNSEINIVTHLQDNDCIIEVIDQGLGIPDGERDKLFTEFGKLSTRPTANESSTGLGLWIVKQMMEKMNGEVGVYCPEGGGSVFWVKLPVAETV